jgi:VanZ family protein
LIFFFSAQSGLPSPDDYLLDFIFKKSAHMFVFAVFYILVWRGVQRSVQPQTQTAGWLLPMIICLSYAALDELHQSLTPGRSATIRDVGYDALGMIIAAIWWYRYI